MKKKGEKGSIQSPIPVFHASRSHVGSYRQGIGSRGMDFPIPNPRRPQPAAMLAAVWLHSCIHVRQQINKGEEVAREEEPPKGWPK